jgi:hypothetical protein
MVRRPAREAVLQDVVFGRSKRLTKNGAAKKNNIWSNKDRVDMCYLYMLLGLIHFFEMCSFCLGGNTTGEGDGFVQLLSSPTLYHTILNSRLNIQGVCSCSIKILKANRWWVDTISFHKTSTNNRSVPPPVLSWFITPMNYTYKYHDSESTIKTNLQKSSRYPAQSTRDQCRFHGTWGFPAAES